MTPAETYIRLVAPAAQAAMRATKIPASITIAQGGLESGWGTTLLAREDNNHFGIKANQEQLDAHAYQEFTTEEQVGASLREEHADFARFATLADCFAAHSRLLCGPRYKAAMERAGDPDAFAWALGPKTAAHPEGCGYSTLVAYHDRLMQLVRQHNLTQYDIPPEPAAAKALEKEQAA
jgi:flagellum-specific peptidoglycan hydrolase FlgJ